MTRTQSELESLNTSFLENRVRELGLKQWWIAEQTGVNRRTVLRWINGQVARIRRSDLPGLARCLQCAESDLILRDEACAYATAQDQAEAARLIEQENLVEMLTPGSRYAMAETLIRSALHPNLPLPALGRLYNLLAMTTARQFAPARATAYARKALAIAERLGNRAIEVGARYQLGWVALYDGRVEEAATHFEFALEQACFLEDRKQQADAWFSLGAAYGYLDRMPDAIAALRKALRLYSARRHPLELSMTHYVLGAFQVELGDARAAGRSFERSLRASETRGYLSGMEKARAGLALVEALRGDLARAERLYQSSINALRGEPFIHPLVFLYGARIARLAGDVPTAIERLREGLPHAEKFRTEKAHLLRELAALDEKSPAGAGPFESAVR